MGNADARVAEKVAEKPSGPLDQVEQDLSNGREDQAVLQWQRLSGTEGRCHSTCGIIASYRMQKCAVCLIGQLLSEATTRYHDANAAKYYIVLANNLQDWIDRSLEVAADHGLEAPEAAS